MGKLRDFRHKRAKKHGVRASSHRASAAGSRGAIAFALLALAGLAALAPACKEAPAKDAAAADAAPAGKDEVVEAKPTSPTLADVVTRLANQDEEPREAAVAELEHLADSGVSTADGLFLIQASARIYPSRGSNRTTIPALLLRVAESHSDVAYVAAVRAVFPDLPSSARTEALTLLASIDDAAGPQALLDLLEAAQAAGFPPKVSLDGLEVAPRFAKVYFPRVLKSAKGASALGILSFTLGYAEKSLVTPAVLTEYASSLSAAYAPLAKKLAVADAQTGTDWMWDDDYQYLRGDAGVVLDLFGYVPSPEISPLLVQAANLRDPHLASAAALSLLRLGDDVPKGALERAAADPWVRNRLFDALNEMGKGERFPDEWATQEAFAEGALVDWLAYPTELGRSPDETELMKTYWQDTGQPDGVLTWYLFRFRTKPPHWASKNGWMAGVAGPFKKSEAPSTTTYGDTFSTLTPWAEKTPRQHLTSLLAITARARENRKKSDEEPAGARK
jgi:hypothetical protein